ncbi:carbohydrate ABC transporter permease [Labedella phragmitis]|uniref:Carbohydrate ABC transporter permease n=1 Tax=Labedella phragmitis TaxID=2498849 RepID=A0A3S3ZWM3_9MICO|nr:carbohydrate ABC transporter permease [Labedella phragmitis]RWZ46305.1 carbohydrate ABC transporter permease [Labedella phragmitis]
MKGSIRESIAGHAFLIVGAVIALYPFLSIMAQALSPAPASAARGVTLENFASAWTRGGFSTSLFSSALVALAVVIATGFVATLAGYALSVLKVRWRGLIMAVLLVGLVLPSEARIIPLYDMMSSLGLLNTYWALILPQIASSFSLATFWMANYFGALPASLAEASSLDGANSWQTLRHVFAPLGMSALATLSCLVFLYTWNEFMLALVLMPDDATVQTAPLSLSFFAGNERNTEPEVIAAAAVLVALPVVIAYAFLQRRFMSGLLEGAVKE